MISKINNDYGLHITHNDADAVGCAMVVEKYYGNILNDFNDLNWNHLFCSLTKKSNNYIDTVFTQCINLWEADLSTFPTVLIVSDISISPEVEKRFLKFLYVNFSHNSIVKTKSSLSIIDEIKYDTFYHFGRKYKIAWFDHHQTNQMKFPALNLTKNKDISAALLMLIAARSLDKISNFDSDIDRCYNKIINDISRYDTYLWKRKPSGYYEFYITAFIDRFGVLNTVRLLQQIAFHNCYYYNDNGGKIRQPINHPLQHLPDSIQKVIDDYANKRDAFIEDNLKKYKIKNIYNRRIALIKGPEKYLNDVMEAIYSKENPNGDYKTSNIDMVLAFYPETGVISLRTNLPEINVGIFAKEKFGGGGHAKAAGASVDENVMNYIVKEYGDE